MRIEDSQVSFDDCYLLSSILYLPILDSGIHHTTHHVGPAVATIRGLEYHTAYIKKIFDPVSRQDIGIHPAIETFAQKEVAAGSE